MAPHEEVFAGQNQFVSLDKAKSDICQCVTRATDALRLRFLEICAKADVIQGVGPPIAYFETPEGKQYIYIPFGMGGKKPHGTAMPTCTDFTVALEKSVEVFQTWLKPKQTLVWREMPSADVSDDGRWATYWRCVQLENDARRIFVAWNF